MCNVYLTLIKLLDPKKPDDVTISQSYIIILN